VAYARDIHVAVYQVLDEVIGASVPPRGAKATIHSIIDDLRVARAPVCMIEQAEAISLQLHYLECAVLRCDPERASNARQKLRSIAAEWLNRRIRREAAGTGGKQTFAFPLEGLSGVQRI
jgi:hypothetical protein